VIANIKCNQEGALHIPKKESQLVELICEVFGYHKTEIALPLGDPIALSALKNVKVDGDKISVDLTLEKVRKGDMMIMFNVFFQPNSNIMRMVSETDLKTLITIMNENPTLKIMVHGHTNGNSSGEIIKIPDDCDDFFAPKNTEHTRGSSMKLSLLRAEAIKMYLLKNGISGDRIEVKGWGGKKMLFNEDSPNYQMNVRVEIEVIDI
jgi:outer membrane protein OmpA-like peptidoglycan-associated protein